MTKHQANSISRLRIALFFTQGMSLTAWDEIGMLDREVALYRRLIGHIRAITFVTYGGRSERRYESALKGVDIWHNRFNLSPKWHKRLASTISLWQWRNEPLIVKSNQIDGAEVALNAALVFHKKFIARCGYLLSDFMARQHGQGSPQFFNAQNLERRVFTRCDKAVVTTQAMRHTVIESYGLSDDKITVIPNYVDTSLFSPTKDKPAISANRICFIGRLDQQKNPFALLEAIEGLNVALTMIGQGPLKERLETIARERKLKVQFLGAVAHNQLARYINESALFILPSLYEGHPKTLLEAMSCGSPVIGANVAGIREMIEHEKTGFLCETNPASIREAIQTVMSNQALALRVGQGARQFILERFSLDKIVQQELDVYRELL